MIETKQQKRQPISKKGTEVWQKSNWLKIYVKGKFAGKLYLCDTDQPSAYISHFEIKPEYRGKGHGNHLLDVAIKVAKESGCTAVALHCAISNTRAFKLYHETNGFFVVATTNTRRLSRHTGLVERHYLMAKQINL